MRSSPSWTKLDLMLSLIVGEGKGRVEGVNVVGGLEKLFALGRDPKTLDLAPLVGEEMSC